MAMLTAMEEAAEAEVVKDGVEHPHRASGKVVDVQQDMVARLLRRGRVWGLRCGVWGQHKSGKIDSDRGKANGRGNLQESCV